MPATEGVRPEPRLRHDPRPRQLVAVAVAVALLTGTAIAYWRGTGSGTGSAPVSTGNLSLTLSPGTPSTALVPGSTAAVVVTLANPNANLVHVSSLTLATGQGTGGFAVDSGHAGCAVGTLHFTPSSTGWTVPAKSGSTNGSLTLTLAGALSMDSSADSACQGATFSVYLSALG